MKRTGVLIAFCICALILMLASPLGELQGTPASDQENEAASRNLPMDVWPNFLGDAQKNKALVERHPKWQKVSARVVSLYKEITEKALENEKNA